MARWITAHCVTRWLAAAVVLVCMGPVGCDGGNGGDDDASADPDVTVDAPDVGDTQDDGVEDPGLDGGDVAETECSADGDCDDADPCTDDRCSAAGACLYDPVDADGDDHAASMVGTQECAGDDCDDADAQIFPGAPLDCDDAGDFDCDGLPDTDEDGDGYMTEACDGDDCDDADPETFPGSLALDCSLLDHDCNGQPDRDNDGDTHQRIECGGGDCDDTDPLVHPAGAELACDGRDTDCDGEMSVVEDADGDGFANTGCVAEGAQADCDDGDDTVYPGAAEACDDVDQDCDGTWTDGGADDDLDGYLDDECGGDDCDDDLDTVFPGAPEVCLDGVDQDCDGSVDGFVVLEPTHVLATGSGDTSVVWTGSEFGVTWGNGTITLARVGEDGTVHGTATLTGAGSSRRADLAWTGSLFGVAWEDGRDGPPDIYYALVEADGTELVSDVAAFTTGTAAIEPGLEWSGTQMGLAWLMGEGSDLGVDFLWLTQNGTAVGSPVSVPRTGSNVWHADLSLVRTDGAHAATWMEEDIYVARTDPQIAFIPDTGTTPTRHSLGGLDSESPSLAWSGSEVGAVWVNGQIRFQRYTPSGAAVGSTRQITGSVHDTRLLELAWTGSEYVLAISDDRTGSQAMHVLVFDPTGTTVSSALQVSTAAVNTMQRSSIAWTGSKLGIVWVGGANVYLALAGFCQ